MWNKPFSRTKDWSIRVQLARLVLEEASIPFKGTGLTLCQFLLDKVKEHDFYANHTVLQICAYRQAAAFFEKADSLPVQTQKKSEVAWEAFQAAELRCAQTNRNMSDFVAFLGDLSPGVNKVLYLAERKIGHILGTVPNLNTLDFSFGPGANRGIKALEACPLVKLGGPLTCSRNLFPTAEQFLLQFPGWMKYRAINFDGDPFFPEECESSHVGVDVVLTTGKVAFVPKSWKTDRTIITEPLLNSLGQKGIGKYIRQRLKRFGVDLKDQTRNQELARYGSISGSLATVDLSSASDTISKALVAHLLPYQWYSLLNRFRTPVVEGPDGLTIELEKFSSMGNAYTFELESLIFYALAFATAEVTGCETRDISVFGDDIIIPVAAYGLLEEVLSACGFSLNRDKSFAVGPFRESCGTDYWNGFDVRPCYLKGKVSYASLFTLHNFFARGFSPLAKQVRALIPNHLVLYGPDGYGDGHLVDFSYRGYRLKRQPASWSGYYFDTYVTRPSRLPSRRRPGDGALPVYSIYVSGESEESDQATDHLVVRSDGPGKYRRTSIYTLS